MGWCVASWLAAIGSPAWADRPLWEAGLGVGLLRLPHYRGSDQSHNWVLPVPYFVYRGEVLRADREGARAVLLDAERVDFDISVAATAPTRSRDNRARQGMPDLAPTVEIGPNVNALLAKGPSWKVQARLPLRSAFTLQSNSKNIGWLASPHVNLDVRTQGWNLGLLAGPVIGSRRMNGYFYDVPEPFATATRPAYRAPGGAAGWRVVGGVSRRWSDLWLGAFVTSDTLRGASFEDSPLVRRRDTLAFGVALSWVFATASQRVPGED